VKTAKEISNVVVLKENPYHGVCFPKKTGMYEKNWGGIHKIKTKRKSRRNPRINASPCNKLRKHCNEQVGAKR